MAPYAEFEGPRGSQRVDFVDDVDVAAETYPEDDLMEMYVNPEAVQKLNEGRKKAWGRAMDTYLKLTVYEDSEGKLRLNGEEVPKYEFEPSSFWMLGIYIRL